MSLGSIVRPFAAALTLALVASPLTAFADEGRAPAKTPAAEKAHAKKGDRARHADRDGKAFPMKADQFRTIVAERLAQARERLTKAAEKRDLPEGTRKEMSVALEAGHDVIDAAVEVAAVDGVVTREEAKSVLDLSKKLRDEARERFAPKKADGKGGEPRGEKKGDDGAEKGHHDGAKKGHREGAKGGRAPILVPRKAPASR